jgi:1-acyl-sn-glycerol-3-phosphate acyltransferase
MTQARSFVYVATFYVVTALFVVLGSWLLFGPRSWAMKGLEIHGRTCTWLLRLICGTRMEVRGREKLPPGACLIVSKHQSAWDTFALIPLFHDPAIVLKEELKWIPFYGWFCLKFEHILVSRGRASAALKKLVADAQSRAAQGRPPGAEPDYKPGYVALYEGLGLPCYPLALNSGLYWPRRSLVRYPGTIIVEILDPIPPGLNRKDFRRELEARLEAAGDRLLQEAASAPDAPPLPETAVKRLAELASGVREHNKNIS